jgi:hypothetical protein
MRLFVPCSFALLFGLSSCSGDKFFSDSRSTGGSGGGSLGGTGGQATGGGTSGGSGGGNSGGGGSGGSGGSDAGSGTDASTGVGGATILDASLPCGLSVENVVHTKGANVTELQLTHTTSGLNGLVIAAIAIRHDNSVPNTIPSPSAVLYGSASFVRHKLKTDGYYQSAELWSILTSAPATNLVKVKFATAVQNVAVGVIGFVGAARDDVAGVISEVAGVGTSSALSASTAGYSAVLDLLSHGGSSEWDAKDGQEELWRTGTINLQGSSSLKDVGAATTDMSWSSIDAAATSNFVYLAVPLAAAPCAL